MTNTILLADDSVTIQKVIELTFMEEDYEVVAASDGDEALERLEEITPDFVIADVHMPGASGIDVCRRSKELHPQVPVLLLVGTFEPFDEGAAQAAGADAHLKKPFDSQELIQLVGDLMGPPGAEEATPEFERAEAAEEEPAGGEPEADDTWGFGAAAAELEAAAAAEPAPRPEAGDAADELDWAGPLEPLPGEETPPAVAQAEEPAPSWEPPGDAGGEPFHLEPVERADGEGEVFDLRGQEIEGPEEDAEPAAEAAPGAAAGDRWGAERWGFAVEESAEPPQAAAGGSAAAEPPAADTGWEEVEERVAGAEDLAWGEPEGEAEAAEPAWGEPEDEEEPPPSAAPRVPGEEESRVAAPPPDWDAEGEVPSAEPPPWEAEGGPRDEEPSWGEPGEGEAAEEWAAGDGGVAEPVPGSGAAYGGAAVSAPEPAAPAAAAAGFAAPSPDEAEAGAAGGASAAGTGGLSEHDVDRIARRVAELLGERVTREVAWEVVPDLAEVVIRERLRELEGQID